MCEQYDSTKPNHSEQLLVLLQQVRYEKRRSNKTISRLDDPLPSLAALQAGLEHARRAGRVNLRRHGLDLGHGCLAEASDGQESLDGWSERTTTHQTIGTTKVQHDTDGGDDRDREHEH